MFEVLFVFLLVCSATLAFQAHSLLASNVLSCSAPPAKQEEADNASKVKYLTEAASTDWAALDATPPLDADLVEAIDWTMGKRAENIISQREQTMRAIKKFAVELARDGEREKWYVLLCSSCCN